METVKDFFRHINIRLSSPLIFSFIISWLVINWKITIGLFFFYRKEDFAGFIDLVKKTITTDSAICYPLLLALLYTICAPGVSLLVKALQTFFEKKSNDLNLHILKSGKISIDKYLQLRESLNSKEANLVEIIAQESSTRTNLSLTQDKLHTEQIKNADLSAQLTKVQTYLQDYQNLKDQFVQPENLSAIFSGTWINEFCIITNLNSNHPRIGFEPFYIDSQTYIAHDKERFSIRNIGFVPSLNALKFHKQKLKERNDITVVTLIKINDSLWYGTEKLRGGEISYVRYYPKDIPPLEYGIFVLYEDLKTSQLLSNYASRLKGAIDLLEKN